MTVMVQAGTEIALIVEKDGRLIGIMTDGDIRRCLLAGAGLSDPVDPHINRKCFSVDSSIGRSEVLDLMRAQWIRHVPIVDAQGRLTGLHLLREFIGAIERPNSAVIMAGGQGERLRSATENTPKPMVSVAGRPILERIILHLVGYGIRDITIAVNYLAEKIIEHFGDGSRHGCNIQYLKEDVPLGTAGALSMLPRKPTEPFFVINGDLIAAFEVGRMLEHHQTNAAALTVGVRSYFHKIPFGVVKLKENDVVDVVEKPTDSWLVNAGIYLLQPSVLERVPRGAPLHMTDLIALVIRAGEKVSAFNINSEWIDVGTPEDLARARGL